MKRIRKLVRVMLPAFVVLGLGVLLTIEATTSAQDTIVTSPPGTIREGAKTTEFTEAQDLVPYDLHAPDLEVLRQRRPDLQAALPFQGAMRDSRAVGLDDALSNDDVVRLYYGSRPGPNLTLVESASTFSLAGLSRPIQVNGVEGIILDGQEFPEGLRTAYTGVHWKKNGMSYTALTVLSTDWTVNDLLAVLDTIP